MSLPSVRELLDHPLVQSAFEAAWADSLAEDEKLRHEEGGWILFDTATNRISIRREMPGSRNSLPFNPFTMSPSQRVVAICHTHPTPPELGGMPDPSSEDIQGVHETELVSFAITEFAIFIVDDQGRITREDRP